jgi:hypothetical protein
MIYYWPSFEGIESRLVQCRQNYFPKVVLEMKLSDVFVMAQNYEFSFFRFWDNILCLGSDKGHKRGSSMKAPTVDPNAEDRFLFH